MTEEWRDISGFMGYQVSNFGNVRSFWKKKRCPTGYGTFRELSNNPTLIKQSDDGNGYLKVMLYSDDEKKRCCKKVHRLVAEAFLPNPNNFDTVDHITIGKYGKKDNSVSNLRWMSKSENVKRAYECGQHDQRISNQNKAIVATDLWDGKQRYYSSINEAADELKIEHSAISHVLRGDEKKVKHYIFEYAGEEEKLLYEGNEDYQRFSWV